MEHKLAGVFYQLCRENKPSASFGGANWGFETILVREEGDDIK